MIITYILAMKALAITAIVSVAVIMGMSAVVPAMAIPGGTEGGCPPTFAVVSISGITDPVAQQEAQDVEDANGVDDNVVCIKTITTPRGDRTIILDNIIPSRFV